MKEKWLNYNGTIPEELGNIERINKLLDKGLVDGIIKKHLLPPDYLDGLSQAVKNSDGSDIFKPLNHEGVS